MTDEMMELRRLVEKTPAADALRDMIALSAARLMEIEVGATTGGSARCEAGSLRRPRRHQHRGLRDLHCHLAVLPCPLHAQRPAACWQERPASLLGHHRYGLREGRCLAGSDAMTPPRLSAQTDVPKLSVLTDQAEPDGLAYMSFRPQHRIRQHSNDPPKRLRGEIKRHTEVVGIFANEPIVASLIGAILRDQSDDCAVRRARYIMVEEI